MILLTASAGGHIAQLHTLRPRLAGDDDVIWATFDTPQTSSLLEGERVEWLDYIPPRGLVQIVRNAPRIWRLLRKERVRQVYSTGSGIALAVFPLARILGIPCTYIESAARGSGPSLTGRILSRVPGVVCRTQYRAWAGGKWTYRESIFDDYTPGEEEEPQVSRLVVTMGTIRPYAFDRLLERLLAIVPPDVEVLCQLGETRLAPHKSSPPNFTFVESLPGKALQEETALADAVVAHAGIGSALMSFNAGHRPVLVVRRAAHGEHVDDHQEQIAGELASRGLAVATEADELSWSDVIESARRPVLRPAGRG